MGGLAAVRRKGKEGYIDQVGLMVIPPKYHVATGFTEGLAAVKSGPVFGFIDPKGKMVIPQKYPYAGPFREGLAAVQLRGDKSVYIDKTGSQVIPVQLVPPRRSSPRESRPACPCRCWTASRRSRRRRAFPPDRFRKILEVQRSQGRRRGP